MTAKQIRGGLRKRRTESFVQVRSRTVRDSTISFRALGVLTFLLDRPEGWDVRAEQLAAGEGREGREAVNTALRELRRAGYYRLERRRFRDGTVAMGTAISEEPVESWAQQSRIFDHKAVPVIEQPDGTFLVRYPDGTLGPDDFPPPESLMNETSSNSNGTGNGFLGTGDSNPTGNGFPGTGFPASGFPASGEPGPDKPSPLTDVVKTDSEVDVPPSEVRAEAELVQPTLTGEVPEQRQPKSTRDRAFGIARAWMNHRQRQGTPIVMRSRGNPLHALASLIEPALKTDYTDDEVKHALALCNKGLPTAAQLDDALARVRTGVRAYRPRRDDNRHLDEVIPEDRVARNPFTGAVRTSVAAAGGAR